MDDPLCLIPCGLSTLCTSTAVSGHSDSDQDSSNCTFADPECEKEMTRYEPIAMGKRGRAMHDVFVADNDFLTFCRADGRFQSGEQEIKLRVQGSSMLEGTR